MPVTQARDMSTTISLPEDLADELYERKARGESYADVIRRLLEDADARADATEQARERSVTAVEDTPDRSDPTPGAADTPATDAPEDADIHAVIDTVAEDTLPGSGAKLEERRAALLAAVAYLAEHGQATPSEFQTEVYPDHRARYTAGENPARSWWKNCIYKGLTALAERTDAVEAADQSGVWRWRAGDLDAPEV